MHFTESYVNLNSIFVPGKRKKRMNKTELIAIAAENAGLTKKDTERVLNAAIDTIVVSTQHDEFDTDQKDTFLHSLARCLHRQASLPRAATALPVNRTTARKRLSRQDSISVRCLWWLSMPTRACNSVLC